MEAIKTFVVGLLNRAVLRYIKRNNIRVIAVAGSIGKTSTAHAIRTVLSQKYRVYQPSTAYNTARSIHLEIFDLQYATSMPGWAALILKVLKRSFGRAGYQYLVIEIGTDHPGELRSFAWLKPDIGVLTAIAAEHMEYFHTIENVAKEELVVAEFCKRLFFNANTVDRSLVAADVGQGVEWYGNQTEYSVINYRTNKTAVTADFKCKSSRLKAVELQVLGEHSLDALAAAMALGSTCGLAVEEIAKGLKAVEPVKGRMQRLQGIDGVTIIDDTYNASPEAVKAALDVLYGFETPQRIAVLGMMNEMGDYSQRAHSEVGAYCDPQKLDLVVTIGDDANEFLAQAAEDEGCTVQRFDSPYKAGEYVERQHRPGAVILYKGSQNKVFTEEAIKLLLADPADEAKLVRQSDYWLARKASLYKKEMV